jgi:hypothetical protein
MTVTCIINQFDFNAGTSGDGVCIFSGKDKLAKPETKSAIGELIEPINGKFERCWIIILISVIPHAKNIKDSYKLLNGKYPKFIQRELSKMKIAKFTKQLP